MNIMIIPLVFRVNSWSEIFELITLKENMMISRYTSTTDAVDFDLRLTLHLMLTMYNPPAHGLAAQWSSCLAYIAQGYYIAWAV